MTISREEVLKVGLLSRIKLSDEDVARFAAQLSAVLAYVGKLQELDTRGTEPLAHALPLRNVLRPDEPRDSLPAEKAIGGAPDAADNFFRVPRVLDDGAGA
jgi:aspartyl-tRNA(Asn)/glutamyl-tRNA(Gln) amidotransferase subunit C